MSFITTIFHWFFELAKASLAPQEENNLAIWDYCKSPSSLEDMENMYSSAHFLNALLLTECTH